MSDTYSGGLDPMTQALIQLLLSQGGNFAAQQPWQGAVTPDVLNSLSLGFDPNQMQQDMLGGFALPPGDPEDAGTLEDQARRFNTMQDFNSLMADPMTGLLTGGGGYSADAFAPEVTRELIPRPETDRFQGWLAQGTDTFEGRVADAVRRGRSPRAAIVELREIYEAGTAEGASEEQAAAANQVRLMLGPGYQAIDDTTGQPYADAPPAAPDWQQAFDDAVDLVQPYLDEQKDQPGPIGEVRDDEGNLISAGGEIVMGSDGQMYRVTTTPSPLAEKYHELGIPLPTETYEPGDLLGADWTQAEQSYLDSQGARDEAYSQMEADRDRALSNATGANLSQGDVFALDQQAAMERGAGGRLATGAAPQETTAAANDNRIHPVAATTTADQALVDEALTQSNGDALIAFVNAHQGEFSLDQLHQIDDFRTEQQTLAGQTGDYAGEQAWGRAGGTIDNRIKEVTPPEAVAPEAITLAGQAQGQNTVQSILGQLPSYLRGDNGMLGQDINDIPKNDPQAFAQWLTTNWSSLSDDERRDATTFIDITAGEQGMNLGAATDPESTRLRGTWQALRDRMNQLQSGTNVTEWDAAQTEANRGPSGSSALWSLTHRAPAGGAPPTPPGSPPQSEQVGRGTQVAGTDLYGNPLSPATRLGLGPVSAGVTPNLTGYEQILAAGNRGQRIGQPAPTGQRIHPVTGDYNTNTITGYPAGLSGVASAPRGNDDATSRTGPTPQMTLQMLMQILGQNDQPPVGGMPGMPPQPPVGGMPGMQPPSAGGMPGLSGLPTTGINPNLDRYEQALAAGNRGIPPTSSAASLAAMRPHPEQLAMQQLQADRQNQVGGMPGIPQSLWSQMSGGAKQPDQATAQMLLRFMLGGRGQGGTGGGQTGTGTKPGGGSDRPGGVRPDANGAINGKQRLYFGSHRASPVDTYRLTQQGRARRLDRDMQMARYQENLAYHNTYGPDFYRARGYTDRLRQLGIGPTQVALAARSGALNTMQGK